ncbi:hypothetical protein U1Q18_026539 [Sarracenia purpurea var. burkii]
MRVGENLFEGDSESRFLREKRRAIKALLLAAVSCFDLVALASMVTHGGLLSCLGDVGDVASCALGFPDVSSSIVGVVEVLVSDLLRFGFRALRCLYHA